MKGDRDVDVLVLGSGAAGLTAALSARQDAAASVLIAEAEGLVGGSSRLSGGLTMGAGTRYQRALGITDGLLRGQGDVAYAVFDSAALAAATAAGVARYKQQIPGSTKKQSPHWNEDVIRQMVAADQVRLADTAAALAVALGLRELLR